ncbi:hypothetical protein EON63_07340 [archaeon]|nr:MAG: hypothetical protein EON63_07340 [archaeon]
MHTCTHLCIHIYILGTTERTNLGERRGIGSIGYQLIRDRRGYLRWDQFWSYPFLEDYATPPVRIE